jgi:hypothetical protein
LQLLKQFSVWLRLSSLVVACCKVTI